MKKARNIVGPVVRELRLKKNFTQERYVAKLNVLGWDISRDTLAKLEAQTRWVADSEIPILAAGLEITPAELLNLALKKSLKPH